ncbi:MAG: class I SAM-dependent methyltransferase [Caldilineaceae bacterium]|nr:class I SAM-dependent methyltransferase [Caldilineaceae bacterium]
MATTQATTQATIQQQSGKTRRTRQVITQYQKERSLEQLREHYEIEKELANRLRNASREERRGLYNEVYDERLRRIPHHPLATKAADPVAQQAAVTPQLKLLQPLLKAEHVFMEVGPGDCALAMAVAPYVRHVHGVDVSDGLVQEGARPENFELHIADGFEIPVPVGSVHVAYSNQMMEHLHREDALEQLANIHRAMAPGGCYVCITPNRLSGPWDISRHFDDVATGLHMHEYTVAEMVETFRQVGFRRVRAFVSYEGHHLTPQLPVAPFCWLEWGLAHLPRTLRRNLSHSLTAVKIVAIK